MKIAEVCVNRPVFAVMLIAFLVTLGVFSYLELGVDLFPRADPATVNVEITLPGAFDVSAAQKGAISTVPGVLEVVDV